jgi:hypothetical protein
MVGDIGEAVVGFFEFMGSHPKTATILLIIFIGLLVFSYKDFKETCKKQCHPSQFKIRENLCMCRTDNGWFIKDGK